MSQTKLALTGGSKAVTAPCPTWPVTGEQEVAWMEEVVRSGKWSWVGPHEMAFCEEYAEFIGTKHCMCLANGTVTLQCALQAVGIEPGHEVIVPALTWVATAQAAIDIGANVVFVDIDPETFCIDPAQFEAAITEKTKAVIPVHLYGCMCDMDAIMDIARRHNLKVVEDTAHQQGSRWRDMGAGGIGDAGSYSFQQSKVLTSGEGGAITCNNDDIYETAFALKHVGWTPPPEMRPANHYGHNYRITEMQAVLLRGGLSRLAEQTEAREQNVQMFRDALDEMGGPLRLAKRDKRITRQAYYAATMHFDPSKANGLTRQQYIDAIAAEGFQLGLPYAPVYRNPLLNLYDNTSPVPFRDPADVQDYAHLNMPVTERVCEETGIVLSHPWLLGDPQFTEQCIEAVRKVHTSLDEAQRYFDTQPAE